MFYCLLVVSTIVRAQPTADKTPILYGAIVKEDLAVSPFDKWFIANYETYQPETATINSLKKLNSNDISIQIFLGTWCGDSRREVPRFMKILNDISFPLRQVQMIGVGGIDSLYKQSPQHEEAGKGIFRVPVFIVYRNGVEINRINEYPAFTLEKDLYSILINKPKLANYLSFDRVRNWMADGTLNDKNISPRSLASQLKPLISGENELNNLGYVLLKQGRKEEALKIFQANASLFPESANVISSLGEAYYETGDSKNAIQSLERSLELNKDPQVVKQILKILYEAKGVKE